MSFAEFEQSIAREAAPPKDLSLALQALWYDAQGDWERAHMLAQNENGREGSWVHAYLHRKEGDTSNAGYWYARAQRPPALGKVSPEVEWAQIVRELLGD